VEFGGYRVDAVVDGEGRLRPDEALDVPAAWWERHRTLLDDGGLLPIVIGGLPAARFSAGPSSSTSGTVPAPSATPPPAGCPARCARWVSSPRT
jgi:hypothetical protein